MKEDDGQPQVIRPVDVKGKSGVQIIKEATLKNCVIWVREDKPNLSVDEVKALVAEFPEKGLHDWFSITWADRESDEGFNAEDGEKEVFEIRYLRQRMGHTRGYYFKGFLFNENYIIGVEFQSAREDALWNVATRPRKRKK